MRPSRWLFIGATLLLASAGCGGGDEPDAAGGGRGGVTVYAAASLTEVFPRIDAGARYPARDLTPQQHAPARWLRWLGSCSGWPAAARCCW